MQAGSERGTRVRQLCLPFRSLLNAHNVRVRWEIEQGLIAVVIFLFLFLLVFFLFVFTIIYDIVLLALTSC